MSASTHRRRRPGDHVKKTDFTRIMKAARAIDPNACVTVDLRAKTITVAPGGATKDGGTVTDTPERIISQL
jgi:hypothetical protein